MLSPRLLLIVALLLAATACGAPAAEDEGPGPWAERPPSNNAGDNNDGDGNNANSTPSNNDPDGPPLPEGAAAIYAAQCANCHGEQGRGLSGPSLWGWSQGQAALASRIDATMPLGTPELCEGACADDLATWILGTFREGADNNGAATCEGPLPAGPRQLRLLTRREYAATVRDLLARPGAACASDAACDLRAEVCEGGLCEPLPCDVKSFLLDPGGQTWQTVHVAGEFNGWASTVEAGGWPLEFDPQLGLWRGRHTVLSGTYQYKFVINNGQTWIQDPGNPAGASDGFGGQNSVLQVDCSPSGGSGVLAGLTADLPVETRPEGFAFDNHAASGRVTPTHVEEYLQAAERLADEVVATPSLLPCGAEDASPSCARRFIESFGARAFRRPLSEEEVTRLAALVTAAPRSSDGYRIAAAVMLSSPSFLYRSELGTLQGDGTWRLDAWETASLLSYTFWGTLPDAELFAAAERGDLDTPAGVEVQARRLLADPRAADVLGTFALQWLGVERIQTVNKNPNLYPGFDAALRQDMLEETRRFVAWVVFSSTGRFDELLQSGSTFANERLARLYGMAGVQGEGLREVPWPSGQRAGLLGQASVLASFAHSDQTSPIQRGLFVRRNLLCQELGSPPPSAGGVPDVDPRATTRERFRQHTDNTFCASCHRFIDPVGFGFERFDAIGQWREVESGLPVDASGDMNDVEGLHTNTSAPFGTLPELAQVLAESRAAEDCFARQVFRFSAGRQEEEADACTLRALQDRFAASGGDIRELLVALTTLDNFTRRRE